MLTYDPAIRDVLGGFPTVLALDYDQTLKVNQISPEGINALVRQRKRRGGEGERKEVALLYFYFWLYSIVLALPHPK